MCTNFYGGSLLTQLRQIDVEDLHYVERDLCYYERVSLGFLLFGKERSTAELVLQKLLIMANNQDTSSDLLHSYALCNASSWREHLVEALAIIQAKRVLRKLGFKWQQVREHFLPHIVELSVNIHPLLKALYLMCERLTTAQAGRLVLDINQQVGEENHNHLRFYEFQYLEIFILNWLTRNVIRIGDSKLNGADVQVLLNYFKLNEMESLKNLLAETIKHNTKEMPRSTVEHDEKRTSSHTNIDAAVKGVLSADEVFLRNKPQLVAEPKVEMAYPNDDLHYTLRRESAGFVVIINQKEFHENATPELKNLLPKKRLGPRLGTDIDRDRLAKVFQSFGYKPQHYENLTHIDLLHNIRESVKRSFQHDSIVICVLSHGLDGGVYGSDSIPVQIIDIEKILSDEALKDKPKLLIIQACQKDAPNPELQKSNSATRVNAHDYLDILKAMSTVPGFVAMRHTLEGTWYIQVLCDTIDKLGDRMHLLDILTMVTDQVTRKKGERNEIMTPVANSTLRKIFRLPSRQNDHL